MAQAPGPGSIGVIEAKVRSGDLSGAKQACEILLASPGNTQNHGAAHFLLGVIEQRSGSLDAAVTQFQLALDTDFTRPQTLIQLGATHLLRQDFDRAEACFRDAIRLEPHQPLAHYNLGVIFQQRHDLPAAQHAFESALSLHPNFPEALTNLANVLVALGVDDNDYAARCYQQAITLKPDLANAHYGLGLLHRRANQRTATLLCFEAAVRHNPTFVDAWLDLAETHHSGGDDGRALICIDEALKHHAENPTAHFKRAQYSGEQPEQIPTELVERLYSGMAGTFDEHLVGHLGYRTPALLLDEVKLWLETFTADHGHAPSVLDLGCGTGLFGAIVRPYAARLVGIDVSAEMLAKAAARGIYDQLTKSDLVSFLDARNGSAESFDLMAASDVLIYIGNLDRLFECVTKHLSAGGVFAFTVESPKDLATDYRLEPSGRFAHHPAYIERLATSLGLQRITLLGAVIRTEEGAPIDGYLFVLKKGGTT